MLQYHGLFGDKLALVEPHVTSPYPSVLPQRLLRLLRLSHKQGKRLLQRRLVLAWLRGEELLRWRRDGAERRREGAERRRKGMRTCARSSSALRHGCSGGSSGAKARTCCRPRSACHLELPDARCRAATADAAKRKWCGRHGRQTRRQLWRRRSDLATYHPGKEAPQSVVIARLPLLLLLLLLLMLLLLLLLLLLRLLDPVTQISGRSLRIEAVGL